MSARFLNLVEKGGEKNASRGSGNKVSEREMERESEGGEGETMEKQERGWGRERDEDW